MKHISMLVNARDVIARIRPEIYGHFAEHLGRCIYGGIFVGENSPIPNVKGIRKDVIDAFRHIQVPTIRWPGGCFAEEYHWQDGVGPLENRKKMVNINWGAVVEDNSFGTHEYMALCELIGSRPYINGNVGSGTVQEMAEWVEYMTAVGTPLAEQRKANGQAEPWKVPFLGVGNENWGCGGEMTAETYAAEFRRYAAFCREHNGNHLCRIACGPSSADFGWMETVMKAISKGWGGYPLAGGIDLHYYTMPIHPKMDSATQFTDAEHYATMDSAFYCDELLTRHTGIMDRYDPENKVGLIIGEWGCWHEVEPGTNPGFLYQQNAMRDALVAAIHLNIFNRHAKRVMMANLAQTVNVLQAILLTDGDQLVKTPTYYVFDLYKAHQNGAAVYCYTDDEKAAEGYKAPMISSSCSVKDGVMTLTLANCSLTEEAAIDCGVHHFAATEASARILTGDVRAFNDFDHPEDVVIRPFDVTLTGGRLTLTLPPCSVAEVTLR
ncbi:MAG: alpha-N-arabinofuranosidase [Clostridia bacterium]|nr:alpha-N-arabinofuranosidase [Clostridia bacterium]